MLSTFSQYVKSRWEHENILSTYNSNNTTKNIRIEMKMARNCLTGLVKFILRETAKHVSVFDSQSN